MSKQPPVPSENQSPYPQDASSPANNEGGEALKVAKELAAAKKRRAPSARQLGIGAAVGVGSAAIVAGLLYWRGNRKDGK